MRPWLYRVATNVCLDVIARDERRRALALKVSTGELQDAAELDEVTWLEPLPDALLEPAAPRGGEPESALLTRETIELSFLAVIQLLTPQQRAALILRDQDASVRRRGTSPGCRRSETRSPGVEDSKGS